MKEERYTQAIRDLSLLGLPDQWPITVQQFTDLTFKERKAVAKLCRAQYYPDIPSSLHTVVSQDLKPKQIENVCSLTTNPFHAGLLLTMLRQAPYSERDREDILKDMVYKELNVLEATPRPSMLNFDCFFSRSSYRPIHHNIPFNPSMSDAVTSAIDRWISSLSRVLIPKLSSKSCSRDTLRYVEEFTQDGWYAENGGVTQVDLEVLYHKYGFMAGGVCEMRQKWYPSILAPRTYYAMGGEAFERSKHLADAFSSLCEFLPSTSKYLCTVPTRIIIPDSFHVLFYDLTSFTSNLHEHYHFIESLGGYCKGNTVRVMDACDGIIQRDLGDMILDYLPLCQNIPYSLERIPYLPHFRWPRSQVGGLLGVYGNIATAKFLHGAVMLQLTNSPNEINVAGDDGAIAHDDDDTVMSGVRTLGKVELSKTFKSYEEGCIHLKRPISQVGSSLFQGRLHPFPSLEYQLDNSNVDNRFPQLKQLSSIRRRSACASTVTSFLQSIQTDSRTISEDADVIQRLLEYVYNQMNLPIAGNLPQVTGGALGMVPAIDHNNWSVDPVKYTIRKHYSGSATITYRGEEAYKMEMVEDDVFECNMNRALSYVEKLGYISSTKQQAYVVGENGLNSLIQEYCEPYPAIYKFYNEDCIPGELTELLRDTAEAT